jgi:hypothetical protein
MPVPLPDVVLEQTRRPTIESAGEIPLRRLVKEALRMRPSIVVGEMRQEECLDLLVALNSGLPELPDCGRGRGGRQKVRSSVSSTTRRREPGGASSAKFVAAACPSGLLAPACMASIWSKTSSPTR